MAGWLLDMRHTTEECWSKRDLIFVAFCSRKHSITPFAVMLSSALVGSSQTDIGIAGP